MNFVCWYVELLLVSIRMSSLIGKQSRSTSENHLRVQKKSDLAAAGPGWLILSHLSNKRFFDFSLFRRFCLNSSASSVSFSEYIYPKFPVRYCKCSQIFVVYLTLCIFFLIFLNSLILAQFLFLEFTVWVRASSPPFSCEFCDFFFPLTHQHIAQHQLWFEAKDHFPKFPFHFSSNHLP